MSTQRCLRKRKIRSEVADSLESHPREQRARVGHPLSGSLKQKPETGMRLATRPYTLTRFPLTLVNRMRIRISVTASQRRMKILPGRCQCTWFQMAHRGTNLGLLHSQHIKLKNYAKSNRHCCDHEHVVGRTLCASTNNPLT